MERRARCAEEPVKAAAVLAMSCPPRRCAPSAGGVHLMSTPGGAVQNPGCSTHKV
jgi:hypothetical protein